MNDPIHIQNLSKTFKLPHERRDTLKENLLKIAKKRTYEEFHALKDVSLNIQKGDFVGVVGRNGSGKTTLLKLIAGIYQPSEGTVKVDGKIAPFLELGIGFQPELTARENIVVNATLLGLTRAQIKEKFDEIVSFAEIENFLDLKIKNFSAGMKARLAFAIAKEADADIYLCDEVLAVGDEGFQKKCMTVFEKWKEEGKTILLVTHNSDQIRDLCTKAFFLQQGQLVAAGAPAEIVERYHQSLAL
ncbi:MAG TPA: ABC transporter ATP-binding protein [Candidatus Gracilibacteria bacterium]|nr:ABC transporter ATP-binding protein [Candidatus Gracilibacteria bacterium]